MAAKHDALMERQARLVRHCRAGLRRILAEPAYREVVAARLAPFLVGQPANLFEAQPWTWAAAIGAGPTPAGPLGAPIVAGGAVLAAWLSTDAPIESAREDFQAATQGALDLDSTLRSHPFPDIHAWSLRTLFAA